MAYEELLYAKSSSLILLCLSMTGWPEDVPPDSSPFYSIRSWKKQMTSGSSEKEFHASCSVCGVMTLHQIIGDRLEIDEDGQTFQRAECQNCGTHKRLFIDPNSNNNIPENAIDPQQG